MERQEKMGVRRVWQKLKTAPEKLGKLFPPGYEYKTELNSVGTLYGVGLGLSVQFFAKLYDACDALYDYEYNAQTDYLEKVLREGTIVEPFVNLVETYWFFFLPWLVALLVTVALHYAYYYRGTKSIYVMRRLRSASVVAKSCVLGPLLQAAEGLLFMVAWYWMYYGIYLLAVPKVCNPRFM